MTEARTGHTATLLGAEDGNQDGRVLIIGTDGSADLYNPTSETFTRVGSSLLGRPNYKHTANLINDRGAVLVAGGYFVEPPGFCGGSQDSVPGAELFAWESDGFIVTGHLNIARDGHTATVLADGITVFIVGGTQRGCNASTNILSSAELFKTGQLQQSITLTGRCLGAVVGGYLECRAVEDVAQCPVGHAAIRPEYPGLACVPHIHPLLDDAIGCRVGFPQHVGTVQGNCETVLTITP